MLVYGHFAADGWPSCYTVSPTRPDPAQAGNFFISHRFGALADRLKGRRFAAGAAAFLLAVFFPHWALAAAPDAAGLLGIPIEFVLFGLTLLGVALFDRRSLAVSLIGLAVILGYTLVFRNLNLLTQLQGQWPLLLNLLGLLLGFAVLARHFEESHVPELLPKWLPGNWTGGFALLLLVALLSTFLDNIAAAIIGGVIAKQVYRSRVGFGYIAAIVAASNAGGAGSVVGDTTTTMMWIAGVPALEVARAFIAAVVAIVFSGVIASRIQHRWQPMQGNPPPGLKIDRARLFIVILTIGGAILGNGLLDFPAAGVWIAILAGALLRPVPWNEATKAAPGAIFLLALTFAASLMPVQGLPEPSWHTALGAGFISAVFNNIPLTALALYQGGYDWGLLAFSIGYGGSLIWFGSSAGVAISGSFPEAKNTLRWIREGWHVMGAYVLGFFVMLWLTGWQPLQLQP